MSPEYPFRGVWRWALLPAWLTLAGLLNGLLGWITESADSYYLAHWVIWGVFSGAAQGLALAVGQRPWLGAFASGLFGASDYEIYNVSQSLWYGPLNSEAISIWDRGRDAVNAASLTSAQLLFLWARRRGRAAALGAALLFAPACVAGQLIFWDLMAPERMLREAFRPALVYAAMLAVAARVSERAAGGKSA